MDAEGDGGTVGLLAVDALDVDHPLLAVHLSNLALGALGRTTDDQNLVILANGQRSDLFEERSRVSGLVVAIENEAGYLHAIIDVDFRAGTQTTEAKWRRSDQVGIGHNVDRVCSDASSMKGVDLADGENVGAGERCMSLPRFATLFAERVHFQSSIISARGLSTHQQTGFPDPESTRSLKHNDACPDSILHSLSMGI